jgi:hypothetical protein
MGKSILGKSELKSIAKRSAFRPLYLMTVSLYDRVNPQLLISTEFDEGWMKDKTIEAAEEIIATLAVMDDTHPLVDAKQHPLRYMFQTTWHRLQKVRNIYIHDQLLGCAELMNILQRCPSSGTQPSPSFLIFH